MAAAVRSERTRVKQAVVIVHGMGEQRPGETVNRFVRAGLPPDRAGRRGCYSRPDTVSDSFEARRLLAPAAGGRPQTEFFEFHWAHLMQGNRLDDLWPTFRRMLLTSPHRVPSGLRLLWTLAWLLILGVGWALAWGPWSDVLATGGSGPEPLLRALFGGGATAAALSYLASRVLARGLTASFVDVVRYLDTSPRSYEVRRQIRKGMIDLLQSLHDSELFGQPRYQRIIVVGHSLGAAIGYDAISYLWDRMNNVVAEDAPDRLAGLAEAEDAAARLRGSAGRPPGDREVDDFQAAQRRLWQGLREQGNPWRVTDLVTVGTPMYFADRLYTRDRDEFDRRVERGELPVCPPIPDPDLHPAPDPAIPPDRLAPAGAAAPGPPAPRLTWRHHRRILHEAAPFAVVRWTNLWFPGRFGLGDWFGGPVAGLFGAGIRDVEVRGNTSARRPARDGRQRRSRWLWLSGRLVPGFAHTRYFDFPDDTGPDSVTTALAAAIDLGWRSFPADPDPDPDQPPAVVAQRAGGGDS